MDTDIELKTMQLAYQLLFKVDKQARKRIVDWLVAKFEAGSEPELESVPESVAKNDIPKVAIAKTDASTEKERVLAIAGELYRDGKAKFTTLDITSMLRDRGYRLSNTTRVMTQLVTAKPALLIQLQKKGRSMQARREFSLTTKGMEVANGLQI